MGERYKVTEKLFDKLEGKEDKKENKTHEVIDKLSANKKKKVNNAIYKMASEEE